MGNHNALLGTVEGVDGIKTGYTEASGYNLTCSVHRNGRFIVAVVLGGKSNAKRDARMRELITENLPRGATQRTAPVIIETVVRDAASVEPVGASARSSLQEAR
jgi:D-alanyl-D-alanine carboxypeptidase